MDPLRVVSIHICEGVEVGADSILLEDLAERVSSRHGQGSELGPVRPEVPGVYHIGSNARQTACESTH